MPAETDAAGVTVVGPSALEADALATAVFIMGSSAGLALLEELPRVEGLIIDTCGQCHPTGGMREFFEPLSPLRQR
jgi:thiamine biosynthesis lipoprotein